MLLRLEPLCDNERAAFRAQVYDSYGGSVPMGLIDTSVGGTMIELWMPPAKVAVAQQSA